MFSVDTYLGNDSSITGPFKTLQKAINIAYTGSTLNLNVGNYDPVRIKSKLFTITIVGSGINTICDKIELDGIFDFKLTNLKLNSFKFNLTNSAIIFENVTFKGYSKCDISSSNTQITFKNCTFNEMFQIYCDDENSKIQITLRECIFKEKKLPLFIIKQGSININTIGNIIDQPLCDIRTTNNGIINILHLNTIFNGEIYQGRKCNIINKNNEIGTINDRFLIQQKIIDDRFIDLNSNVINIYNIKSNVEFIYIRGNCEITLILPEKCEYGHLIEIISLCPFNIQNMHFTDKCKIRYMNEWIFY